MTGTPAADHNEAARKDLQYKAHCAISAAAMAIRNLAHVGSLGGRSNDAQGVAYATNQLQEALQDVQECALITGPYVDPDAQEVPA